MGGSLLGIPASISSLKVMILFLIIYIYRQQIKSVYCCVFVFLLKP